MKLSLILKLVFFGLISVAAVFVMAAEDEAPPQDAKVLHFASRAVAYYPDSVFTVERDERIMTPSGAYRWIEVRREAISQFHKGVTTFMLDEATGNIWSGSILRSPLAGVDATLEALREGTSKIVTEGMLRNMQIRVTVDWEVENSVTSTLMPFELVVETGYGHYRQTGAATIDGSWIIMGGSMPFDEDPVTYRKSLFENSKSVIWDHQSDTAVAAIVEFSDLECPACRTKWPLINSALKKHGDALSHGMVSFPLPTIHPWAFRAACAAWCVGEQDPAALIDFKELFYGMQRDMENSLVTPTTKDFLAGKGLDEEAFNTCYLKAPSIDAVHAQMAIGRWLGINSTPTYFVDGWLVQMPDPSWFDAFIDKIVAGEDP